MFEAYDVDVVYRYDRTHENLPDAYIAELPELGLEFLFDSQQRLSALFMEISRDTGFDALEEDPEGLPKFVTKGDAIDHASRHGVRFSEGRADFLGEVRDWVRFEYEGHSVHYEFVASGLQKITLLAHHC